MEQTQWLPVVEFDGIEFVVDVEGRRFRSSIDPDESVGFYSERGRNMIRAMIGTQWHAWTPREVVERELVV